jgi:heme exporter protein C
MEKQKQSYIRKFFSFTDILGFLTIPAMLVTLYLIFFYAPIEKQMGIVQKIFYFHVPIAWSTFLSFFFVFLNSVMFLWKRDRNYDIMAHASAEVGIVFCTLVLITGPIWGKPAWGAWWTWDSRLTTTLILWLIFIAYLMLRQYGGEGGQLSRFCAVLGIVGFLDVPLIYLSVKWWRTQHPPHFVLTRAETEPSLDPSMLTTFQVSLAAMTLLFLYVLSRRIALAEMMEEVDHLRKSIRE